MMNRTLAVLSLGLALISLSCSKKNQEPSSTPTSGNLTVYCAESASMVVSKLANQFMVLYSEAHIKVVPVPTRVAMEKLLNGETTLAVTSVPFDTDEVAAMKKYKIRVDSMRVALDGVVVIVNSKNPVTKLSTDQLRDVFTGKIDSWHSIDKGYFGRIIPALESPNSGTLKFFKDRVLVNQNFGEAYPCTTMAKVYSFVAGNENGIGLVSTDWFTNGKDSLAADLKPPHDLQIAEVDSIAIKYIDPNTFGSYYYPYQAHIGRRYYPLTRPIYFMTRDFNLGLGAGFLTYAASSSGQQIFLNNGLVPATMPIRYVQLNDQPL